MNEPNPKNLKKLAKIITAFGRWYNGFESHGDENIPNDGPAMIVFYHGLMPLDVWYFGLNHYLKTGRLIRGLGDRWLFKTPVMRELVKAVGGVEGRPEIAIKFLKEGNLVGVSPGGVREAISGSENNYKLIWGNRMGFAKLALETRVPIIPGFTKNVEEIYRAPFASSGLFQALYEATRLPLVPILGLGPLPFPAKLVTYIGEPIYPTDSDTPESIRQKTKHAIEELIKKHQPNDQTILSAVRERF